MAYLDNTGVGTLWNRIKTYISGLGYTSNIGTVTSVTVNGSTYSPTNGDVDLGTIGGGGGSSVQGDWAQTDNTANDYIKNKPSSSGVYWGAWTASSSAATYAQLTDKLILPEGVYIVRGQTAYASKQLTFMLGLTNAYNMQSINPQSSNMTFYLGNANLLIQDIVFVGSGGGEVWIQTAANTSVTYSNTQRGFIAALKLV